jgi:cobalt/nickel transport system permease protein
MIDELLAIENLSGRESFIHNLDARVKILVTLAVIIAMVSLPFVPTTVYTAGGWFFLYFLLAWFFSTLELRVYVSRLMTALPFGFMLSAFQIFVTNRYYSEYHVLYALPFGVNIYIESVQFASMLLVKFFICFSFIILLSSTTALQDLLEAFARLGVPGIFILALGLMVRYLYTFVYMSQRVMISLHTRCFDPFDRSLPYRYRISQMGYTLGSIFIRSFEQGERTHMSMLCRGYGNDSNLFISKKSLASMDIAFLAAGLVYVVAIAVAYQYLFV